MDQFTSHFPTRRYHCHTSTARSKPPPPQPLARPKLMARVLPSLSRRPARRAGLDTEVEVLRQLDRDLPDAYTLFHGLDWATGAGAAARNGELDIVVVNQAGDLLLIEVKGGDVDVREGRLVKQYAGNERDVERQVRGQFGAMRSRLTQLGLSRVVIHTLLVLPDARLVDPTLQWPLERIVDAREFDGLAARVAAILGPGTADDDTHARVCAFLSGRFRVEPDVSAMSGRLRRESTRIASGLATWVPRMQIPSGLIRVQATAGSGKTQLAIRMLRDADAAGHRAAYLCFNRALADHMARLVPVRVTAETFHERALRMARAAGQPVNFDEPGTFDRLARHCLAATRDARPDLDFIVLDEVQDLQPEWVEAMLQRLRADGRALLLEDPSQQLYADRAPFELPDAAVVVSHENYRTPRELAGLINLLRLTDVPIEALAPCDGQVPDPIEYDRPERVAACTVQAVQRCLDRGFALGDIAVISLRGRERSALLNLDRLGTWPLRRFTGRFDADGNALWTDGELTAESVRRFKGQAAPAVVVTECDFETLDAQARRLLFTAFTRVRMHCEWVVSGRVARQIAERLSAADA